jgi:hypothetical protein
MKYDDTELGIDILCESTQERIDVANIFVKLLRLSHYHLIPQPRAVLPTFPLPTSHFLLLSTFHRPLLFHFPTFPFYEVTWCVMGP